MRGWEYFVTVLGLFGKRISGWIFGIISIVSAIASAIVTVVTTDTGVLNRILLGTAGVSLLATLAVAFLAQYDAWNLERNKYEAEVAKTQKPDLKGDVSAVEIWWYTKENKPELDSTVLKFQLAICNHGAAEATVTGLHVAISDSDGKVYSAEGDASHSEVEYTTSRPVSFVSSYLDFSPGTQARHVKTQKLKDVIFRRGITQYFEDGSASFSPPLPTTINPTSLSFAISDYVSRYNLTVGGEVEMFGPEGPLSAIGP